MSKIAASQKPIRTKSRHLIRQVNNWEKVKSIKFDWKVFIIFKPHSAALAIYIWKFNN